MISMRVIFSFFGLFKILFFDLSVIMIRYNIIYIVIVIGFDVINYEWMLKERLRCYFMVLRVNREKYINLMIVCVGDMLIVKSFLYKFVYIF